MTAPSPLLDVKEACAYLRVSVATLYRLINRRDLKRTKIGDRTLFRQAELERFLDRHTREKR